MLANFLGLSIMMSICSYTDIKKLEVEDKSILVSGVLCLMMNLTRSIALRTWGGFTHMAVGAAVGGLIGFLMFLLGMGFGDTKVMLVMGGYLGAGLFFLSLLFAVVAGALYGLIWKTLIQKKSIRESLPFVPFLFFGCIAAITYKSFLGGLF